MTSSKSITKATMKTEKEKGSLNIMGREDSVKARTLETTLIDSTEQTGAFMEVSGKTSPMSKTPVQCR